MMAAPPDSILRRVTERTWAGTLHGYRVQVFYCGDSWCFAVIDPEGYTDTCQRVTTFGDGARLARAWIARRAGQVKGNLSIRRACEG